MTEAMTTQDPCDPWGADPTDRWVMVRAEACASGLWHVDGTSDTAEGLPPIPLALAWRIEALAERYDALDRAHDGFPATPYWEQRADAPVAALNEEGRAIARALKAALPPDWTVVHEDVDAWLRPAGEPPASRQLILAATPPTGHAGGSEG